jgi:hypothetical protein
MRNLWDKLNELCQSQNLLERLFGRFVIILGLLLGALIALAGVIKLAVWCFTTHLILGVLFVCVVVAAVFVVATIDTV